MTAYGVASYRITNPEAFSEYPAKAIETIVRHGGEVLAADQAAEVVEGEPAPVNVIIRFPSKEAAREWYRSEDYSRYKPTYSQQRGHGCARRRIRDAGALTACASRRRAGGQCTLPRTRSQRGFHWREQSGQTQVQTPLMPRGDRRGVVGGLGEPTAGHST